MMNDLKNALNETEMENVAGGINHTMREMKVRQEEARKQAEAAKPTYAHPHSGASGGW